MFQGFKKFILHGNVVELAVGVVIGAAFNSIVSALVKDVLTPLISAVARVPDFSGLSFTLHGATFMIGDFLNALISFLLVSGAVYFFVVAPMNALHERMKRGREAVDPSDKKCPECLSDIPIAAKRCKFCSQAVS